MTDFLLELRSEEIPARMQVKAKDDLARLFADEIAKAGLTASAIETFATPRRLALIARGLPDETAAVSEERKGPRSNAPEAALAGFLRSTGLTREQLVERDGVFFAVIDKPGRATADVLAEAIPSVVRAFPWPKSMRWGDASLSTESLRWVRPLQGIIALYGDNIVPFSLDYGNLYSNEAGDVQVGLVKTNLTSGRETMGHRFHHGGPITIESADTYVEQLRAAHVIVHLSERTTLIRDGARAAATAEGLVLVEDEGLVLENAGLTEWPVPLLGRFDPDFLGVPREVIQLTMRTNQKYFACTDSTGALANAFVCTANIDASDGGEAIVAGNRKVLAARLSDAKFFWENDLKVPLADQAEKLSQIVFHEKLGTVADKVERVAKLARWLVEEGIVGGSAPAKAGAQSPGTADASSGLPPSREHTASLAETAARLCKADLVTGMVGEFPELQGIIGGHLARAQGLPDAVADAIRDHYKPVGQGDEVPTAPVTVAVSLADKLDLIFYLFARAEYPTGSSDPFALRRAALGALAVIQSNEIRLSIETAYSAWFAIAAREEAQRSGGFDDSRFKPIVYKILPFVPFEFVDAFLNSDFAAALGRLANLEDEIPKREFTLRLDRVVGFLADRLKVQQREAGVRHDLIDAVFALGGEDDLVRLLARVKALQTFVGTAEGTNLLAAYKRATNILHKSGYQVDLVKQADAGVGQHQQALRSALDKAEPLAASAVENEDFEGAMGILSQLRVPIDDFFENVLVNDPDVDKARANLAILYRFRDAVHRVADFSKIEG